MSEEEFMKKAQQVLSSQEYEALSKKYAINYLERQANAMAYYELMDMDVRDMPVKLDF
jgi:hypothetical protein